MSKDELSVLAQDKWFFSTNTQNLITFISQGLITESSGMVKYYRDILEDYPGWIPLFRKKIPKYVLDKGQVENSNLSLCILELSISNIKGLVKALKNNSGLGNDYEVVDYELGTLHLDKSFDADIELILIPGTIPLTCIKFIYFESKEEKILFESAEKIFSNLAISDFRKILKSQYPKIISTKEDINYKSNIGDYLIRTIDAESNYELKNRNHYTKTYAIGGALINSFYFTKNGDLSNSFFKSLTGEQDVGKNLSMDLEQVFNYVKNIKKPSQPLLEKMYTGIFDTISCQTDVKDNIIGFLDSFIVDDTPDLQEKSKKRARQISNTLTEFEQTANRSASDFFKTTKSTVEKSLFMLFLRDSSDEFIEFNLECFTEEDYLLYSLMFGMRDGFMSAAKCVKESVGIQLYISEFMANNYHKSINSGISFGNLKDKHPLTLQDMFNNKKYKSWFSKQHNIDAVTYTFKIPKGRYEINITSTGVEFCFDQEPKCITVIDEDIFSEAILSINVKDYNKYINQYDKVK
jgi:hypothetical protein|tara:strand:+ start:483 stop:2045 length:1563 start_codon:yes stop_codon:yes gene_type:complete